MDATKVPGPSRPFVVKGQEPLVGECVKKVDHEERVAVGLRVHQLCERLGLLSVAAERVPEKPSQVVGRQRIELDILHPSASGLDRLQFVHKRMRCSDFVVPESADEEKIAEIG